jgi:hypothetical protein
MTSFQFEPELSQPPPRRVRLRDGFAIWVFRLIAAVPGLLGLLFVGSAAKFTFEYIGHVLLGVETEGQVVAKGYVEGDPDRRPFVEFVYVVDGQMHSSRDRISGNRYESLDVGDRVPLRVPARAPQSARIKTVGTPSETLGVLIALGIAAVPAGIAGAFFWNLYYVPWVHRRLARQGTPTRGVIREIESGDGRGGRWFRIQYEFENRGDDPSRVQTGSTTANGPAAEALKVGDVVTVVYDPQRPRRSVLYALGHYQAVASKPG